MAGKTTRQRHSTRENRSSRPASALRTRPDAGIRPWRPSVSALMEGCWLALAFLTPSLFNPASLRVFEPEKVALVRAMALVMVALWAAERLLDRGSEFRVLSSERVRSFVSPRDRPIPFVAPVAALMACYLLASLFSELPEVALFGSYRRQFGLVTHFSFAVIFLAVATYLRSPAQGSRLLYTIALGALIPPLYAVLQKVGLDPVPWSVDNSRRVVGTLGQPTFLGAHLAAVLPVTLWLAITRQSSAVNRVGDTGMRRRGDAQSSIPHTPTSIPWLSVLSPQRSVLVGLLVLETAALLFSQSRGAWAGALVGCGLVLAFSEPGRALIRKVGGRTGLGVCLAATVVLLALNLPGSPLGSLARQVPYLERLATLGEFESGSGRVRAVIWAAVPPLVAERPILGHGPDVMGYAFERHYPPELAYAESRTAAADQAHNILLQQLAIAGVPGLAAFLWLIVAIGHQLLVSLTPTLSLWRRGQTGETPALSAPDTQHPTLRSPPFTLHPPPVAALSPQSSVLVPVLGGLVGFLVEQMVGVASASAYLLFWLLLGLVSGCSRGEREKTDGRDGNGQVVARTVPAARDYPLIRWAIGGIIVVVAGAGILRFSVLPLVADVRAASAPALASQGRFEEAADDFLRGISLNPEAEYYLLLGQMATDATEQRPAAERVQWLRRAEEALAEAERINPLELDVALAQGKLYGLKAVLSKDAKEGREIDLTPSPTLSLAASGDWQRAEQAYLRALRISPSRSYVHNRLGALLAAQGRHAEAIERYRASLAIDPAYAATYAYLADSLLATGRTQEALDAYLQAERLDPSLILVHINLAELYLQLGNLQDAVREYEAAVAISPSDQALHSRLAALRRAPN